MINRPSKHELVDEALHEEIAALADVMLAAASVDHPLSQDELDHALGVSPEPDRTDGDQS
jgi:hypothetical protein